MVDKITIYRYYKYVIIFVSGFRNRYFVQAYGLEKNFNKSYVQIKA